MRKIISCLILFLMVATACKKDKNESDNLSCDELKKRMEQKGDEYDVLDKASCTAYVNAMNAYAKAECLSDTEKQALEILAMSLKAACE
ncbi:MAG: hypothetical protein KF746_26035 [Chitinophagaceae bacterium]|nr:hypothetical protein [Chitinophagaceae bacterium]